MAEMSEHGSPVARAAVLIHPDLDEAQALARKVEAFLTEHGVEAVVGSLKDAQFADSVPQGGFDLIVAVGGDGTMLRAGELGGLAGIPVLGINLGRLGFLIEVKRGEWREALAQVIAGDYWLENRMRLHVQLLRAGGDLGHWEALNEAVVGRGRTGRPIRLRARVNGSYLGTYVADALICASATGSTAYALAAGGPILPPRLRNLLLVPVAPHLSMDRGIVLPEGSSIQLELQSAAEADLSCDGLVRSELLEGDAIVVQASERDARFVRLKDPDYFFDNLTSYMNSDHPSGVAE